MNQSEEFYMQFTFREFSKLFPELAVRLSGFKIFIKDPKYIVRIKDDMIEIGYSDDVWLVE